MTGNLLSGSKEKKTQRGQVTNRSVHPKIYPTNGTTSGLKAESHLCLANTALLSHLFGSEWT